MSVKDKDMVKTRGVGGGGAEISYCYFSYPKLQIRVHDTNDK